MFDNNNKVFAYKIELKFDPYLVALFHLCYDVYVKLENIEENNDCVLHATELFKDSFYESLGVRIEDYLDKDDNEKYYNTKDTFFGSIASLLNRKYLKDDRFVSKLKGKEHLYYFKDTFTIYSTLEKSRDLLNNLDAKFKTINVISELLDSLKNEILKESIKSIVTIYDFNKAGQYIKLVSDESFKPALYTIKFDLLDSDLIEEESFDYDNIWVNYEHMFSKNLSFVSDEDEYFLILDKESKGVLGLKVNDRVLLKYNKEIESYVRKDSRNAYLWKFFKQNLFRERQKGFVSDSELVKAFKSNSTDVEFNQLLCNLQHNLYIDRKIKIEPKYQKFFEEFIIIKSLDHLSNFEMFIPDESIDKELLAIYATEKIGKKYNLLHHLKHIDDKHYLSNVNSIPHKKDKIKVNILKVELSFYFIEKYYEDVIEGLLDELDLEFMTNAELFIGGDPKFEIDFIIFKNNRFYFIEAKTSLTKDNVYTTTKKFNSNLSYLKQAIGENLTDFQFLLFALLSNTNIDNYKHFFVSEEFGYNTGREDFNVIPHKFNVPLFNHKDVMLECIAEPEVQKLKNYIEHI